MLSNRVELKEIRVLHNSMARYKFARRFKLTMALSRQVSAPGK